MGTQEQTANVNEWTLVVWGGNSVRIHRFGDFRYEILPAKDTYRAGEALAFARELAFEFSQQLGVTLKDSALAIGAEDSVKQRRDNIFRKIFR